MRRSPRAAVNAPPPRGLTDKPSRLDPKNRSALQKLLIVGFIGFVVYAVHDTIKRQSAQQTSETTSSPETPIVNIDWSTIDSIYNLKSKATDLQKDELWKDLKGKKVKWAGKVTSVGESFGSLTLQVKMNPDTWTSDLLIKLKDSQRSRATRLIKEDSVTFTVVLDKWGSILPITLKDAEIVD